MLNVACKLLVIVNGLLFGILLYYSSIFGIPFEALRGIDTNEIMQDYIERKWRIEETTNKILAGVLDKNSLPKVKLEVDASANQISFGRLLRGYGGLIAHKASERGSYTPGMLCFVWNKDIVGSLPSVYTVLTMWKAYDWLVVILPTAFFLVVFLCLIYCSHRNRKLQKRRFDVPFYCYIIIFFAVFYLLHYFTFFTYWRNYHNTHRETATVVQENLDQMDLLLKNQSTGIYKINSLAGMNSRPALDKLQHIPYFPRERQERNIHHGEVFLSRTPFFPYNYVRINVDLFTYLFYAPELTEDDLFEINRYLVFKPLENGLWLGKYQIYTNVIEATVRFRIISTVLWFIMLLGAIILLLQERKLKK